MKTLYSLFALTLLLTCAPFNNGYAQEQGGTSITGAGKPIALGQILSGKSGVTTGQTQQVSPYLRTPAEAPSRPNIRPYTGTGSSRYRMVMNPSDAVRERARQDARGQAQTRATQSEMSQKYLDQEYLTAFQDYQAQFRDEAIAANKSGTSAQGTSSDNVRVIYNRNNQRGNTTTPQPVFKRY